MIDGKLLLLLTVEAEGQGNLIYACAKQFSDVITIAC